MLTDVGEYLVGAYLQLHEECDVWTDPFGARVHYWDHREELDRDIQRRLERVEELRNEVESLSLAERLEGTGPGQRR